MIDIHAHILPGVDDGPRNRAEALDLLHLFLDQGVTDLVCSSHLAAEMVLVLDDYYARYLAAFQEMQQLSDPLPIRLYQGFEHVLAPDLPYILEKYQNKGYGLTIAGSDYILAELPGWLGGGLGALEQILFSLGLAGYMPILAHPERIARPASVLPVLADWVRQEKVLLQVNVSALVLPAEASLKQKQRFTGRHNFVRQLLDQDLVHFVASDAHGPVWRPPENGAAFAFLKQNYGEELARRLMLDNPAAVLADRLVR